jgi:CheY-like chemotaxis protein
VNAPGHTGERPPPKATILNVNDHPATLYMLSHMLRMAGYQVLEASTGKQALAIAAGRPDLVLLDVHLPDEEELLANIEALLRLQKRALYLTARSPTSPSSSSGTGCARSSSSMMSWTSWRR